jgi:hypothetical protein
VKSKGFKIIKAEEIQNSENSEKFQKEKVGCDPSQFYAPSSSNSVPSGSPLPNLSNLSFFGNSSSGSNDMIRLQNKLKSISVPKNLVPEQFRIKRGIDLNIIRAKEKESTKTRSGSTSEGEEEDENAKIVKYKNGDVQIGTESILGVRRMGKLVYQPLEENEKTLLRDLGGDIDLMYNFLPSAEKKDLYKRAFGKEYAPSELFNIEIPRKIKNSPADKRGHQLQVDGKMLAEQATAAQKAFLGGRNDIGFTYLRDVVYKAADIATRGSMTRLWAANPQMAAVLNYSHQNNVITPKMIEEFKKSNLFMNKTILLLLHWEILIMALAKPDIEIHIGPN